MADKKKIMFGVFAPVQLNAQTEKILADNFNFIRPGVFSWSWLRRLGPEISKIDFALADRWVALAQRNKMRICGGNPLVYNMGLPDWLMNGKFTRDELIAIMREHFKTVLERYKGIISEWVVVNEALWVYQGQTGYSDSVFYKTIGPDYIEIAYQLAREADPSATLIYNDYANEIPGQKADVVFDLVRRLKIKNLVDAVGMQYHIGSPPVYPQPSINPLNLVTKATRIAQMKRYADIGVKVKITELDVDISGFSGTKEEKLSKQAELYKMAMEVYLESGVCDSLMIWGLNDEESWILPRGGESPLLFSNGNPKPAYYAIRDVLVSRL